MGEVADGVERWAHLNTPQPQMLCGPYEGRLLAMLCRALNARCVVEIGAYIGYSTVCLAQGVDDGGVIHSFEVNDEYESVIRRHLQQAGVQQRVSLHIGDARSLLVEVFPESDRVIDMAFIDAGKRDMKEYYELLLPRMRVGGIIVVDNVLWGGKTADYDTCNDADTRLIRAFNDYVQGDPRVENILLGLRDGLLVILVKE